MKCACPFRATPSTMQYGSLFPTTSVLMRPVAPRMRPAMNTILSLARSCANWGLPSRLASRWSDAGGSKSDWPQSGMSMMAATSSSSWTSMGLRSTAAKGIASAFRNTVISNNNALLLFPEPTLMFFSFVTMFAMAIPKPCKAVVADLPLSVMAAMGFEFNLEISWELFDCLTSCVSPSRFNFRSKHCESPMSSNRFLRVAPVSKSHKATMPLPKWSPVSSTSAVSSAAPSPSKTSKTSMAGSPVGSPSSNSASKVSCHSGLSELSIWRVRWTSFTRPSMVTTRAMQTGSLFPNASALRKFLAFAMLQVKCETRK
mmetsp:Transcript_21601/g.64336  ORF Transcript_21601/g.64336 Transcript_21601/m.64336 type:complete len:315 (+) Transcript_21601:930-1874(+)